MKQKAFIECYICRKRKEVDIKDSPTKYLNSRIRNVECFVCEECFSALENNGAYLKKTINKDKYSVLILMSKKQVDAGKEVVVLVHD